MVPRRPEAERRTHEEPVDAAQLEASHDAVARCDRGRDKPDAHFLVPGTRIGHSPDLKHLGGPVRRANGGSHALSLARSPMAVMNSVIGQAIQPVLHVAVTVRGVASSSASSMREKGNCAVSLTVLTRLRWSASNRHRQRDWAGINVLRM